MADNTILTKIKAYFTTAASRENLTSGEELQTSLGKVKKWFSDLGTAAFTNSTDYAASSHNQASSTITAMTGYTKPQSTSAITASDTLNEAIGKLEKGLDGAGGSTGFYYGYNYGYKISFKESNFDFFYIISYNSGGSGSNNYDTLSFRMGNQNGGTARNIKGSFYANGTVTILSSGTITPNNKEISGSTCYFIYIPSVSQISKIEVKIDSSSSTYTTVYSAS